MGRRRQEPHDRPLRVRYAPRRITITDGHEAQAMAELRLKRHTRLGRFLLELVGWPVAKPVVRAGHPTPSHLHSVHHERAEHPLDPSCGTCGARLAIEDVWRSEHGEPHAH